MKRPEQEMQKAVASYLYGRQAATRDLIFCHVPNGGWRSKIEARIMKGMGVQPGAPDLIIWLRDRVEHIELKAKRGRLSENQEAFGARLESLGYRYSVVAAETPGDAVNKVISIIDGAA